MKRFENTLHQLEQQELTRTLKSIENDTNGYCYFNGKKMLNLSSNDYLGLASNIELQKNL